VTRGTDVFKLDAKLGMDPIGWLRIPRAYLTGIMPCPECNRLRQHYEAALRQWGHLLLSLDAHLVGAAARQNAGIKPEGVR
jgi:hypothetical protein